ncbi:MAG: 2-oxoacid:acceptor oxidoreductase subunit alpha [Candidatus Heimdallarchaeota archaeon]|nr:MAG: 2-oxoacid:acceptor oxidoreductase subunit alpha [Candidatus Heimdallarchaeota archaeon]
MLPEERKTTHRKEVSTLDHVVIRLAGDSGDGMQLAGLKFTTASVIFGNDISTFPDFPGEIRAPAGTLAGVSGFQIHFSSNIISTPGDELDALVVMNPAALRVNLADLKPNGILIVNQDTFSAKNLKKAGYNQNPLEDDSLRNFRVYPVSITTLNQTAVESEELTFKQINLTKNFFALGLISWLFDRPLTSTVEWIEEKFKHRPTIINANIKTLKAGYNYGETTELFPIQYHVPPAKMDPGLYKYISGNEALSLGLIAAANLAKKEIFYGAYPITPASDLLHELVKHKEFGIRVFQAEDEIAAIGSAIGASFGGLLGVAGTSGPGFSLMTEALGLAVITELPLVVINVQRAGPSTGMPTKPEQGDLLQALFGRNGESPLPVIAPQTPGDCFETAIEAVRIAMKYMTPVVILSDGFVANTIDPWKIPDISQYEQIEVQHPSKEILKGSERFYPYLRNENLVRPWAIPGTEGLEYRTGGLEKEDKTGGVSYDPLNHEKLVKTRAEKIRRITKDIQIQKVEGPKRGDLLVLSWGSTYGAAYTAAENMRKQGFSVSNANLKYLNPFPQNLEEILQSYEKILIPEMNLGQLQFLIQARYSIKTTGLAKVQGRPIQVREIQNKISTILGVE